MQFNGRMLAGAIVVIMNSAQDMAWPPRKRFLIVGMTVHLEIKRLLTDKSIIGTTVLNQRIKDIMCMRAKQGFPDPTPTLVDIERTHILFVNAHFKPFAAIGYESTIC